MPRFIFQDREGREVGRGEGEYPTQAAMSAGITGWHKALDDPGEIGITDMAESLPQTAVADANAPKKRKPRADKGVSRKAEKPKKERKKAQYFAVGTFVGPMTRTEAERYVGDERYVGELTTGELHLIAGHEVKFTKRIQFSG